MSRPETLAGVSNHGRLSCVPIRNVSPSLSPAPLCSSFIVSLRLSVSNLLFSLPSVNPSPSLLLLVPSLPLVFLLSESCLRRATRSSFPAYLSALGSCFHDSLDVTGKMPFRARVSLADPFRLAACGPCDAQLSKCGPSLFSNTCTPKGSFSNFSWEYQFVFSPSSFNSPCFKLGTVSSV